MSELMTFEDSVKARLRSVVAELIPEDKWDAIVRKAVVDFQEKDLPALVKSELMAQYKVLIAQEFAKPEWRAKYTNGMTEPSEAIQKLIIDSAPLILASMIGHMAENVMQQFRNQLQNYR